MGQTPEKKFLGILGGMGPAAGAYLFQKILAHTPAKTDQDHLEILLYSNSAVPDRTQGILGLGPSAEPELMRSVKFLHDAGVRCILIACVTAHHYLSGLRQCVTTPILSIVEETADHSTKAFGEKKRIGLLATTGTLKAGVFQDEFTRRSLEAVCLPEPLQETLVMHAIYGSDGIKAGRVDGGAREMLFKACDSLVERGADLLVAGCTEIPLVLQEKVHAAPLVDPMDVLARSAVRFCLGLEDT